jgi:hypothetical protein
MTSPLVPLPGGTTTTLDITTATVIKSSAGRVFQISVMGTAGSAVGAIYDATSTSGNTVANQIAVIPEAIGTYPFYAVPTATGIVVVPPTGSTVSVSWS